ncbi:MAG TPA: DUF2488 domain-containing protein [Cyanobacteria bacterium UBA8156]|nr:DUF2488 domain-containing protein [Cyanobacteria bacterium UBA8156]
MQTYYFVAGSRRFLCEEEPLAESLVERERNYQARGKERDFWLVESPAFLERPELAPLAQPIPRPAAAVVSTDPDVIRWLKLRLAFVVTGEFQAHQPQG